VIRTADASGVDAVVCCDGTVDPTNPKTVRASAGSVFHTPIVMGGAVGEVVAALHGFGFVTLGTVVRDGEDYTRFDWTRRVAVVLGNEASGLDDDLAASLDARVTIPMAGRAESLNVAVSAAVLCFEALRQRRAAGGVPSGSTIPAMDPTKVSPGTGGGQGRP
jgi:TrmH family RNA methyltransferase